MKREIFTLLTIFIFYSCENPKIGKNDLESMNLKGNVVSFTESIYNVSINNNLIDSSKCSDEIIKFNDQGYISEKNLLYPDGETNQKENYYYNKNFRISKKELFNSMNEKISITKYKYFSDSDTVEIELTDLKDNIKKIMKYEDIHDTTTLKFPTTIENEFYTIDHNKDTISFQKNISTYNSNGNIINEKQIVETNLNKNVKSIDYTYIYDEYRNWIKKTQYIDSIPNVIITRNFIYR